MKDSTRYARQLHPQLLSAEDQAKLHGASVVVCGCGGLGSPVSTYLAAAGVGTLHLFDQDRVTESNLNRQTLYTTADIGQRKAFVARERLVQLNPEINIIAHPVDISQAEQFLHTLEAADVLVDCLDNLATRRFISRAAIKFHLPLVHGGIHAWQGQIAVFLPDGRPTLDDILEQVPQQASPPVIGAVAGIVGSLQALEVIKLILGKPTLDTTCMHVYDGLEGAWLSYPKSS